MDIAEKYRDPNCLCPLCTGISAWIQQSAKRAENTLVMLQELDAKLQRNKSTMSPDAWDKASKELMVATQAAHIKLGILLDSWAKSGPEKTQPLACV